MNPELKEMESIAEIGPGSKAFVSLINTNFPSGKGLEQGYLVSRVDYGIAGHTPVQHHRTEEAAKEAAQRMNDKIGVSENAAYLIMASTMPSRAGHPKGAPRNGWEAP